MTVAVQAREMSREQVEGLSRTLSASYVYMSTWLPKDVTYLQLQERDEKVLDRDAVNSFLLLP